MEIKVSTLAELPTVADKILQHINNPETVIFTGEMGAGKTTLIKAICASLNVVDSVTSPTYSLVNEYATEDNSSIYHFDFYRINDEFEAVDMGAEEYFDSNAYCFVEWASLIPNLLPDIYWEITITQNSDNSRTLNLTKHGE